MKEFPVSQQQWLSIKADIIKDIDVSVLVDGYCCSERENLRFCFVRFSARFHALYNLKKKQSYMLFLVGFQIHVIIVVNLYELISLQVDTAWSPQNQYM